MQKKVIGLVGTIASGKGVVANFLAGEGYLVCKLSDVLRQIATENNIPLTRDNLQNLGDCLRAEKGNSALVDLTLSNIPEGVKHVVIDGLRNPGEIACLRQKSDCLILGIDAPIKSRLKWYLWRSLDRGEDLGTSAEFFLANARDLGVGEDETGQQVSKSLEMVDVSLYNSGTKEELLELLESVLEARKEFTIEGRRRSVEK